MTWLRLLPPRCVKTSRPLSQARRHSAVATAASVLEPSPETRDWFYSRMRRSDLRIRAKADRMRRRPARDAADRTETGSSPRAGTNAPQEANACCVLRATDVRSAFEDERKRQPPGSVL